jgi:hypothetical protein
MRLGLSALVAAALSASVATTVLAQTQTPPTNPNTKVLAYKKTAPSTMNPGMNADPASTLRQQKPLEHMMPDSAPYGSAAWWHEVGRTFGGGDGGGQ